MTSSSIVALLARFWLGTLGGALAGYAAFGRAIVQPDNPSFESAPLAALVAMMLALVRTGRHAESVALGVAYGAVRWTFGGTEIAIASFLLPLAIYATALVFHEVGRAGVRFGKFLVVGPLVGGAAVAVAPLSMYAQIETFDSFKPLMLQLFLGIVIGDGAGLGVEVAESLPWRSWSGVSRSVPR